MARFSRSRSIGGRWRGSVDGQWGIRGIETNVCEEGCAREDRRFCSVVSDLVFNCSFSSPGVLRYFISECQFNQLTNNIKTTLLPPRIILARLSGPQRQLNESQNPNMNTTQRPNKGKGRVPIFPGIGQVRMWASL